MLNFSGQNSALRFPYSAGTWAFVPPKDAAMAS